MKETSPLPHQIPEHKLRCDRFMQQVKDKVVEKYPRLDFWIEDRNKRDQQSLARLKWTYQMMNRQDQIPPHLLSSRRRKQAQKQETSTLVSQAKIEIIGKKPSITVFNNIFQATQNIDQLATQLDSQRTSPTREQLHSDVYDSIYYPGAVLIYRFT